MKENNQIYLIKSTAVLFTVSVHFLLNSGFYEAAITTPAAVIWMGLRQVFITAVPLFLIATGYLMNKKTLTTTYFCKLLPVYATYLFISLTVWLVSVFVLHEDWHFSEAVRGILNFSTVSYSWYVEMYLGLYLMIPVLNLIWHARTEKHYHHYLVLLSGLLFFVPSLLNSYGKVVPDFWQSAYPVGYYFFGAYFSEYAEDPNPQQAKQALALLVILLTINIGTDVRTNYNTVFQWLPRNDYFGYQTASISLVLFYLGSQLAIGERLKRVLKPIATATLSIYLLSDLTDKFTYQLYNTWLPHLNQRMLFGLLPIAFSFTVAALTGIAMSKLIAFCFASFHSQH